MRITNYGLFFFEKKDNAEKHKEMEMVLNIQDLKEIILFCKDKFPNYSHYLNLENIYFYLLEKLEIKYYSYINQSKATIKIYGKHFVEKNKNNCSLIQKILLIK